MTEPVILVLFYVSHTLWIKCYFSTRQKQLLWEITRNCSENIRKWRYRIYSSEIFLYFSVSYLPIMKVNHCSFGIKLLLNHLKSSVQYHNHHYFLHLLIAIFQKTHWHYHRFLTIDDLKGLYLLSLDHYLPTESIFIPWWLSYGLVGLDIFCIDLLWNHSADLLYPLGSIVRKTVLSRNANCLQDS